MQWEVGDVRVDGDVGVQGAYLFPHLHHVSVIQQSDHSRQEKHYEWGEEEWDEDAHVQ